MNSGEFSIVGLLPIIIGILLLLLLVAGFVIWRAMFSEDQTTDFSSNYDDGGSEKPNSTPTQSSEKITKNVLKPATISTTADTVSNQTDEDVVDELKDKFSNQATVDTMGDLSVSADDSDEEIDLG